MNKLKNKFTFLLLIAICISSLLLFTGCKEETVELFVSTKDAPRATYVQGQELDLTQGKITFIQGEETSDLPLNAEGVSVTGYNKDQLGEQTLTVTYMEKTAEFKVNVIPRIKAESFETKYFINDEFDKSKGKLIIARDDATTFSVNMNNDKITLVSFDSSAVGESTVKVNYTADSLNYDCEFNVNVYGIASVTLTRPTKITYHSHEEKIDISGGYLTVKSTEDGGLSKFVNITTDMISGFDITAATKENIDTPLKQTVTITYGGQTFTYDISITYSGVSIVNDLAKMFEGFDWESSTAVIDQARSDATIEAINAYYKLSKAQKALISNANVNTLVRATAVVASLRYRDAFKAYDSTIKIGDDLSIRLVASSYEESLEDLQNLQNEDGTLNVYAEILRKILDDFPNVVIANGKTVEQVVAVHSNDIHDFLVGIFTHLTELYENLQNIPANWTDADLKANEDNIKVAINSIKSEKYVSTGYSYLYSNILSKWREKNDYVEILYYYYLNVKEDSSNLYEDMFQKVPLPGIMQTWYNNIVNAVNECGWLRQNESGDAYLSDITPFMYYYNETIQAAKAIKDSGNELYLDIYEALDIDYLMDYNIRVEGYGYFYQCGPMLDSERFMTLWEKYLVLVDLLVSNTLSKETHSTEFKATLDAFSALSPAELYGFLTSLNFQYDESRGSVLALDYDKPLNIFTDIMGQYCDHVLNDSCEPVYRELLTAMEKYALLGAPNAKASFVDDFKTAMASVVSKYTALTPTDRANFRTYFGVAYDKYLAIYNVCNDGFADASLGAYADTFNELALVINNFNKVYDVYNSKDETVNKNGTLALMIALYERAKSLYEVIVATGDDALISALHAKGYTVDEETVSLDLAFSRIRFVAVYTYMLGYIIDDKDDETYDPRVWDVYSPTNADQLLNSIVYLLYAQFDSDCDMPDDATVLSIMANVRGLITDDIESVRIFTSLQGDVYYYAAISAFLAENLSDSADVIGEKLVAAEKAYRDYKFSEKETYLDTFKTLIEEIKAAYDTAVTEDDKAFVEAMYNCYVAIYDSLVTE